MRWMNYSIECRECKWLYKVLHRVVLIQHVEDELECCEKTTDHINHVSVVKKQQKTHRSHEIYKCCKKTTKKSQQSIYHNRYRKLASYAKNKPMHTARDVISPEYVDIYIYIYIKDSRLICGESCGACLGVTGGLPLAWPLWGETHGYSLRTPPQIFLWNIPPATPWSHSSPTPDIPNALPEVLLRLLLLEVSYKRNTFRGLLLKASSLVAISCSIADHHTYTLYTIDSLLLSSGGCH